MARAPYASPQAAPTCDSGVSGSPHSAAAPANSSNCAASHRHPLPSSTTPAPVRLCLQGCYRSTEVETLFLITRTGRMFQIGRGGCTHWFRCAAQGAAVAHICGHGQMRCSRGLLSTQGARSGKGEDEHVPCRGLGHSDKQTPASD